MARRARAADTNSTEDPTNAGAVSGDYRLLADVSVVYPGSGGDIVAGVVNFLWANETLGAMPPASVGATVCVVRSSAASTDSETIKAESLLTRSEWITARTDTDTLKWIQMMPLAFATLAERPAATTVLVGTIVAVVNDLIPTNNRQYIAVGAALGSLATVWV